jgi:hypothetical protein
MCLPRPDAPRVAKMIASAWRPHAELLGVHAGTVFYDANGCCGETLDAAFRLLDAPSVKEVLRSAQAPLVLVVSAGLDSSVNPANIAQALPPVTVQVAGNQNEGRVSLLPG